MKKILLAIGFLFALAAGAQAQTNCVELREIDGTPDVKCVKVIKVTNGTLACTGSTCTLTISGGGGGSPGGSDTNVQYNDSGNFGGVAGFVFDKTSKISLGVAGTSVGAVAFRNATSGTITLQPVTGALGTVTLSLPATTGTLALTSQLTSGTVTSVAQSFTGGLISVGGSPITTSGTLALTVAGTSGGIPYFSSGTTWASSGALTANLPVIGGGAGAAPTVGTRSGNTTQFVTTTGTLTSGDCVKIDASGNFVANGSACGGSGITVGTTTITSGTNTRVLFNNSGVVGEYSITGTGNVAMSASPTFTGTVAAANAALTSSVTTGTGTSAGFSVTADSLTTGVGANFASSSITSGSVVNIASTSTAAASNTQTALNVATSGANGTSAQTTYGAQFSNTHTGTSSTNIAGNFTASGGTANTAIKANYTITGSDTSPLLDLSGTWNTTGAVNGIKLNITNTASNVASSWLTLQKSGTSFFQAGYGISFGGDNFGLILGDNVSASMPRIAKRGASGSGYYDILFDNDVVKWYQGYSGNNSTPAGSSAYFIASTSYSTSEFSVSTTQTSLKGPTIARGAADAASPVAIIDKVQSVVAGTSNTAGVDWTHKASAGTGTGAGGSFIIQTAPAGSSGTSQNSFVTAFTVNSAGHFIAGGTAPSITSGFGTSPSIAGTDQGGRVTVGTGGVATTGVVTFGKAFATAPACVVNNETTVLLAQATATTTTLTITSATPFAASDKLTYVCVGY